MDADEVIGCVQAVLELSSMIAARVRVELRLKNFALQVLTLSPLSQGISVSHAPTSHSPGINM